VKKLISLTLVFALFFQFSVKIGVVGYFMLNQEYIENVLCINRDKPELNCKGRCQLKKQLQKSEANERKLPFTSVKEIIEIVVFCEALEIAFKPVLAPQHANRFFSYPFVCIEASLDAPFHPPRV
jgi:hypothetical protein